MKENIEPNVAIPEHTKVRILEPTVNIRALPSLQSAIIATGYADKTYVFLNEEKLDDYGVT